MKRCKIHIILAVGIALLFSCKPMTTTTKDIKHMSLHFKPLERTDLTLVGNLEVESTITGKLKGGKKVLDPTFSANYNKGLITKTESTEMMYFAPKEGQTITGSLYENDIFNSVMFSTGAAPRKLGFFESLMLKFSKASSIMSDPGVDFAYYAMIAKYPEVDYFINVRFDRKLTTTGKTFTEIIKVKADGVVLKTN